MADYRYKLASTKAKKVSCPHCSKLTHWQLYIDTTTGNTIDSKYGKCDNESKCGEWVLPPPETKCFFVQTESIKSISDKAYVVTQKGESYAIPKSGVYEKLDDGIYLADFIINDPKGLNKYELPAHQENEVKYFVSESGVPIQTATRKRKPKPPPELVFYPENIFKQTLVDYDKNVFIQNLLNRVPYPFGIAEIEKVISLYYLGTISKDYRAGAITFPFIDKSGYVRTIQVKQFDENNSTLKKGTDFLHSMIERHYKHEKQPVPVWIEKYNQNILKVSCLFGEHLLNQFPTNTIALCEAPKTAIYGTLYFGTPDNDNLLWLAVYNLSSLKLEKCKALSGRNVILFPDLSKDSKAYQKWSEKAKEFNESIPSANFIVDNLLERNATESEKLNGLDLADYLINQDWRKFKTPPPPPEPLAPPPDEIPIHNKVEVSKPNEPPPESLPPLATFRQASAIMRNRNDDERVFVKWNVEEVQQFFNETVLPKNMKIRYKGVTRPVKDFVSHCLYIASNNNGKPLYRPYYDMIVDLKEKLSQRTKTAV